MCKRLSTGMSVSICIQNIKKNKKMDRTVNEIHTNKALIKKRCLVFLAVIS